MDKLFIHQRWKMVFYKICKGLYSTKNDLLTKEFIYWIDKNKNFLYDRVKTIFVENYQDLENDELVKIIEKEKDKLDKYRKKEIAKKWVFYHQWTTLSYLSK